jgi:hypothetical protein
LHRNFAVVDCVFDQSHGANEIFGNGLTLMRIYAAVDAAATHEQEDAYGYEWVEAARKLVSGEPTLGSRPP